MIKLFVMDVDGTMTDGKIYMGDEGEMFKAFDIKDGLGIHELLPEHGIKTAIITGRYSRIVENRARELSVDFVYQGVKDKVPQIAAMIKELGLKYENVAYIGDDLADLGCMRLCGVTGCPSDAVLEIREIAGYIAKARGGQGAVREFIEWLLQKEQGEHG